MAIFDEIKTTTPYDTEDYVLRITMTTEPNSYRLANVIHEDGAYVFSIWHRSDTPCMITFQLFGDAEQMESTPEWKKYYKQIKIPSLTDKNIDITPPINSKTYYYEAFLAKGTIDTSWSPAPEDYDEKLNNVKTEFIQTAERIEQKVTVNDGRITSLTVDVKGIQTQVSNTQGDISTLQQTSSTLSTEIKNAKNDISSLQQTATGLSSQVSNNKDEISTLKQTATEFSTELSNNKDEISKLQQRANEIVLNVSKTYATKNELAQTDAKIKVEADRITSNITATTELGKKYSDIEQTAEGLTTRVENAEGKITTLEQTANGLQISLNDTNKNVANAAKTATNFLSYDSSNGLQVGNKSSGSWSGYRTKITGNSLEILDESGNVSSSFQTNAIDLGKNSINTIIRFCGAKGNLWYNAAEDFFQLESRKLRNRSTELSSLYTISGEKKSGYNAYTDHLEMYSYESDTGSQVILNNQDVELYAKNKVIISAPNGIDFNPYKSKVIYEGSGWLDNGTINFPVPASSFMTGIVLVFSLNENGTAQDWAYSSHFIPKYLLQDIGEKPYSFILSAEMFNIVGIKFCYISNTRIVGHESNNKAGTKNGITFDNRRWALRRVYGV